MPGAPGGEFPTVVKASAASDCSPVASSATTLTHHSSSLSSSAEDTTPPVRGTSLPSSVQEMR